MKKVLFLISVLFISLSINAQSQANVAITGSVFDNTTKETIEAASIRILNARDSSYVTGTVTDDQGKFSVSVKPASYIVQISFMGYRTQFKNVDTRKGKISLGDIFIAEDGVMLQEAVVTAKAVEMIIKGDTIEYNADSYKVQESAVLEDLVKKIPGAEVSAEGKITINGKEISKILVDGKEFFSDDPKVASKNLPAKMVEKLQVLDRKSDLAQMTGFDDGDEETVINLTVKPGMKEGLFGNVVGGYGTKDRYEGNGMLNYMRNSTQLSVLGGLNNTNNAGFTDFASTMAGSRGGGPPRGVSFGGTNGVAKTSNLGINLATEFSKKLKMSGDARYGSVNNDVITTSEKIYGTNQLKGREMSRSTGNSKSENFGANLRFEWKPDTLTTLIFRPSMQYNKNRKIQDSNDSTFYTSNALYEAAFEEGEYWSKTNGLNLGTNLTVSRKLNSAGRSISFDFSGKYSNSDGDDTSYSITKYFEDLASGIPDSTRIINQLSNQEDRSYDLRAKASYVEPLGRNNFLELSYSIRNNTSKTDKHVDSYDLGLGSFQTVDSLTRNVESNFVNQNVTLSFQSMRKNFNYTIGVGLEPSSVKTDALEPNMPKKIGDRKSYLNFAPRARFNYVWDKRQTLRIDYQGSATAPSTRQLYDGVYSVSGTNTTIGNPNLRPSFENRLFLRYQKFNPEKASAYMFFARLTYTTDAIVNVSTEEGMMRVNSYANADGNMTGNARFIINMPLRNKKFSVNSMTFASYNRSHSFVTLRDEASGASLGLFKNRANTIRLQENVGLRFVSDLLDFSVRGNVSYNQLRNSVLNTDRNVYDYGGYTDFTLHLPYNFNVDSDLNYSANSGYGAGFEKREWLWNASLSKDIFKAKNGTLRVKIYDILQQRSNVSWSAGEGYTENITTNTVNSYVMFSFAYRFQSFKGGVKMNDMNSDFGGGHGRRGPR